MLEWLKTILGDGYTPEIDAAVSQEIGRGFVSRGDFNAKAAKAAELEARAERLAESARTYTAQLAELKRSAGDAEALARRITEMEEQAKADRASHEKELARVKLLAAVDAELTAAGARNNTAVKAVLADFLKDAKIVDGRVTSRDQAMTLGDKVEALKKDAATDFLFGSVTREGWRPGEAGGGGSAAGGKRTYEMSYSELREYLAANPGARLD